MRSVFKIFFFILFFFTFSCKKKEQTHEAVEETLISGSIPILVDNTVQPVVEDVLAVFHNHYGDANITQINKTENEIIQLLHKDSARVAVLSRRLSDDEEQYFKENNIVPRIREFATDAIVFISNESTADSILNLKEVISFLKGEQSEKIKGFVFDNPGSSIFRYLTDFSKTGKNIPASVYSLKTTEEVIKYVHNNTGNIGVVGLNWLLQPPPSLLEHMKNIKVLAVNDYREGKEGAVYYKPTQSNIAEGLYPLTRKLYILNYQGKNGLGTGFASYIEGRDGQRIILKSGLLPAKIPSREISVRGTLEKKKE